VDRGDRLALTDLDDLTDEITIVEVDDRAGTVPRCVRCGREVKVGGEAATPTWEMMSENAPDACWRSMRGSWAWCSGSVPWTLTIVG
jgi:hypothetical protein